MKKLILTLLLVFTSALTLAACSGEEKEFTYSEGIKEDGYWKGIQAVDFVQLPQYESIEIPADIHTVSQEDLDTQVQSILTYYSTEDKITDRAIASGDKVNIDYVGTVDGTAFEGGDTEGNGTDVVIGETQYIDDFLDQLIGHKPGETFDVLVTFPEDYGVDNLNGKDAVFRTTINHISETIVPEATDAFVAEKLQETYGWTTVDEMKTGLEAELQKASVTLFIQDFIVTKSTLEETPQSMITYQERAMIQYYTEYAKGNGLELDQFLTDYMGLESKEALLETYQEDNKKTANYYLVLQAIAEKENLQVTEEDITTYFKEVMGLEDYSEMETYYGMPFIKMSVLQQKVMNLLIEQAKYL